MDKLTNQLMHRPDYKEKLFFFISGGIISTPFPTLVYALLNYFITINYPALNASVIAAVIVAPIIEEFAKIYPLFYRHGETARSLFGLAFLTGLGFGVSEFSLYVFAYHAQVLERLPLIFFHASNTAIISYGISRKKVFAFYLTAVILHGVYNIALLVDSVWYVFAALALLISYLLAIFIWVKLRIQPEGALDY